MTRYEKMSSFSIDELTEWIYEYGHHDDSPWMTWFDKKYCTNCTPIRLTREEVREKNLGLEMWYSDSREFSYCEVNHKCRFFDEEPNLTFTIRTWLEEEIK